MEMTEKCKKEIERVKGEIQKLQEKEHSLKEAISQPNTFRNCLQKERNKTTNDIYKKMDKIQILKSIKISTSQRSSLLNEAKVMKVVKSAKSLGMTDFKAIGFSKILNNYVIVFYGKYSSIMSNVKGCSSLANKRELSSFEIITNEEFEKLMKEDIS